MGTTVRAQPPESNAKIERISMSAVATTSLPPFRARIAAIALLAIAGTAEAGSIWSFGGCVAPDCSGPVPNVGFVAVAAGNYHAMGLKADGSITAWGLCDINQCDVPFPNIGYEAIAAGDSHSLALRNGVVTGWGGEYGAEFVPEPNSGCVAIAAGFLHSLALRADGSIAAWGANHWGQLEVPAPNTGFVAVSGSGNQSLALKADGSVVKWGCGPVPCELPVPNTGFVAIAGHHEYSLAIRGSDGAIVGWGSKRARPARRARAQQRLREGRGRQQLRARHPGRRHRGGLGCADARARLDGGIRRHQRQQRRRVRRAVHSLHFGRAVRRRRLVHGRRGLRARDV